VRPASFKLKRNAQPIVLEALVTRTGRRLFAQVDFRREMRPIAFVDPAAFLVPNPSQISQNETSGPRR
jgi:hypothetical protein